MTLLWRIVLVLAGAIAIMFFAPLLSWIRYHTLPLMPLPLSGLELSDWVFHPMVILIVGFILGYVDQRVGWLLAPVASSPAAVIRCQVAAWNSGAVVIAAVWVGVALVGAILGSALGQRRRMARQKAAASM